MISKSIYNLIFYRLTYQAWQFSFSLTDLIRLGDVVPHVNSRKNIAEFGRFEVHNVTDPIIDDLSKAFEDRFKEVKGGLAEAKELDDYLMQ